MGDIIEARPSMRLWTGPFVTGLKGYMGHTMSTCGVIETLITLYMMQEGFVAPTLNLEEPDERCAIDPPHSGVVERPINIAAIQNFAFGASHEPPDQTVDLNPHDALLQEVLKSISVWPVTLLIWVYFIGGFLLFLFPRVIYGPGSGLGGPGVAFQRLISASSAASFRVLQFMITPDDASASWLRRGDPFFHQHFKPCVLSGPHPPRFRF